MAQWVTYLLLGETEDQSSDPQHHPDGLSGANLQPDCWGAGQRQRFLGFAGKSVSFKNVSSRFSERPSKKKYKTKQKTNMANDGSRHWMSNSGLYMHIHAQTHTHVQVSAPAHAYTCVHTDTYIHTKTFVNL